MQQPSLNLRANLLGWAVVLPVLFMMMSGEASATAYHAKISLTPERAVQENPYYRNLLSTRGKGQAYERLKITYLINEVSHSPYQFVRNGSIYDAKRAARHLRFKYSKAIHHKPTARDFIEKIASGSFLTGQPYYVKTREGNMYPVKELLFRELKQLESYLKNRNSGQ